MKVELEDLAFKYLEHNAYNELNFRVSQKQEKREHYTEEVTRIIREELRKADLVAEVEGRAKHLWSIHKKMQAQHIEFDEVYDLIAFRIILASDTVRECYAALSMIHSLWKPVPGRFKDYIAIPKANNYKSLHTTVIGPYGERMEVQIRTRPCTSGPKRGSPPIGGTRSGAPPTVGRTKDQEAPGTPGGPAGSGQSPGVHVHLKMALFPDEVYVFTPNGDVRAFPKGATPIDFAYSVHYRRRPHLHRRQGEPKHRSPEVPSSRTATGGDHHAGGPPPQQGLAQVRRHVPGPTPRSRTGSTRRNGTGASSWAASSWKRNSASTV